MPRPVTEEMRRDTASETRLVDAQEGQDMMSTP